MLITDDIGQDPSFLKDMAQSLEGTGFDAILTNDHVAGGHPDRLRPGEKLHTYDVACHEPLVLLSFLGAVTFAHRTGHVDRHQHPAPDRAAGQAGR